MLHSAKGEYAGRPGEFQIGHDDCLAAVVSQGKHLLVGGDDLGIAARVSVL